MADAYSDFFKSSVEAAPKSIPAGIERAVQGSCQDCKGISIESLSLPGGQPHPELAKGSNCQLCLAIYFRAGGQKAGQINLMLRDKHPDLLSPHPYLEVISEGQVDARPFHRLIPLYTIEGDPAQKVGVPLISEWLKTSSDRTFEMAYHWIQACDTTHDCQSHGPWLEEGTIPTPPARLLDLSPIGNTLDIRIVDVNAAEPPPRYSTLSYCWGANPNVSYVTTAATLELRKRCLEYKILPLTIQHAIEISRRIGLRYLWVDALCIIQDSEDDWKIEAVKMGSIYARSYVTIAADSAQTAGEGCFRVRRDFHIDLYGVTSTLSNGSTSVLYMPVEPLPDKRRYLARQRELKDEPLSQRGWVLQERILSPRILHYTENQLFWECRSRPRLVEEKSWFCCDDQQPWIKSRTQGLVRRLNLDSTPAKALATWYLELISNDYSRRKLSFPTDILPAISGLASLVNTHLKSQYLAGIWYDGLEWALLWYRTPPSSPLVERPDTYLAPSWSWASVIGPVSWRLSIRYPDAPPRFVVEEACTTLTGKDLFGVVESGFLRVRGCIQSVTLDIGNNSDSGTRVCGSDGQCLGSASLDYLELPGLFVALLLFTPPGKNHFYLILRQLGVDNRYRRVGLLVNESLDHRNSFGTTQTIVII